MRIRWKVGRVCVIELVLGAVVATGCAGDPEEELLHTVPSQADFSAVSSVLERRCGSLDCHGSPARSLRVYGRFGLRENGADVTGGGATTAAEVSRTYESVVSLDPQTLSAAYLAEGEGAERWLVLSKGSAREQHQGGPALPPESDAEVCVRAWVSGAPEPETCAQDELVPIPRQGEEW